MCQEDFSPYPSIYRHYPPGAGRGGLALRETDEWPQDLPDGGALFASERRSNSSRDGQTSDALPNREETKRLAWWWFFCTIAPKLHQTQKKPRALQL
jgi:hypothetical protein